MEKLVAYKRMPLWNKQTMPEAVQQKHNTKVGTWGKITVLKGALKFIELTEEGEVLAEHLFEAGADNPMAQPQAWHRVEAATDDVEWYLEFYCKPEDYFAKKYNTNPVHSEVLEAMQTVKQGKALDLGCGQGRNSLFLAQQDFDVTAVDQNGLALEILQSIVEQEDLDMPVGLYDICRRKPVLVVTTLSFVPWTRRIILARLTSHSPLKKENWQTITRIGNWLSTMKIQAICTVAMRMAIVFNYALRPY